MRLLLLGSMGTILMAGNLSIDLSVSEVEDTTPLRSDRVGQKSAEYYYEGPRELDALLPRGIQGLLLLWLDYGTDSRLRDRL